MSKPAIRPIDFDLRQLAMFCKIVECQNFTRAAQELFLTQPTLSARIADLERRVGARLLDRRSRAVVPTKAGEILYEHARELLRLRNSAVQVMNEFLGMLQGELIVGASTTPGEYILPPLIADFIKEKPGVSIRVAIADSEATMDAVLAGRAEVGVVGSRPRNHSFHTIALGHDELVLIAPAKHPLTRKRKVELKQVLEYGFVDREPGSGTRLAMESALRKSGVHVEADLRVVVEVGSTEAVKRCVEAGAGIAMIPRRAISCERKMGSIRLVPVVDLQITRSIYLILDKDRTPSPICREFVKYLTREGRRRLEERD